MLYTLFTSVSQLYRGAVCRSCDFRKPVRYRYDDPASPLQWDDRGADRIYGIDPYRRSLYRRWHRLFDDRDSFADESNRICNLSCYLQQLEGQFIYPRVVGASIGLPGIWVLAAVTIGGSVLGIGGMLLFVPLTATVYKLLRNDVKREMQGRRERGSNI